jgi:thymidine phosphorylase
VGGAVARGDRLATIHARNDADADRAEARLVEQFTFADDAVAPKPIVLDLVT